MILFCDPHSIEKSAKQLFIPAQHKKRLTRKKNEKKEMQKFGNLQQSWYTSELSLLPKIQTKMFIAFSFFCLHLDPV